MSNISTPGERFTLWRGSDGKPVEKTLAEMTAGEVVQAAQWQEDETRRLTGIAAPWDKIAEDLGRGIEPDITGDQAHEGVAAIRAASEAIEKNARLMQLLLAAMPQWHGSGLTFGAAVRRYWPRRADWKDDVFFRAAGDDGYREGSCWGRWGVEHRRRKCYVVYLVAGPRLTEFDNLACARRFCEAIDGLTDWSRPHTELTADKELGLAVHQAALRVTGARPNLPPPRDGASDAR